MPLFPPFPSMDEFAPTQPIFPNLSPSEELHVLMARIAELTRATQVGPSVAGSEVFGQDGNVESTVEFLMDDEAQEQEDRKTPTMDASVDQLANIQNDQKKLLEKIGELQKTMEKANAEQLAKMQNEILEIGKWVKQQQQKEKEQQEREQKEKAHLNFLMNFWDPMARHEHIELIGNDFLTVRKDGKYGDWGSVFAKHPFVLNNASDRIFYFEISIRQKKSSSLYFGFAFKRLNKLNCWTILCCRGTYAFSSCGYVYINGSEIGRNAKHSYGVGDVVGIGVNLANRQMIFTKNGLRLDSCGLYVDESSAADDLFPFVLLASYGYEIKANFGPDFEFDLANLKEK